MTVVEWRLQAAARGQSRRLQARVQQTLAVLLQARGAQPGQTMAVDRALPAEEFLDGQGIA